MADTATIVVQRLHRSWLGRDLFRAYRVFIDGEEVGRIRRNGVETFVVRPGHRRVHLKIDWVRSNVEELDLRPGQTVVLTCEPGGDPIGGANDSLADSYILLSVLD